MAQPVPDDIDEDLEMIDEDEEGDFCGEDMLVSLLTTEEGDSITTVLANVSTSMDTIAKHLEKQNLILVKLLTVLSTKQAPAPVHIAAPA